MEKDFSYTIKDLPEDERPREKLYKYGPKVLSNTELLAIIIRTGNRESTAIEISQKLLAGKKEGISFLIDANLQEIMKVKGIGQCKAAQILAAVELGKRVMSSTHKEKSRITSPTDIVDILMLDMIHLKKEHFKIVMLDTKNQVIGIEDISIGSLNSSIVHPREVFKEAIVKSSASIILVHNHPSGDPAPSKEDIAITRRLAEGGEILGIKVLDHIIIGNNRYISLKEKDII
ncbi:DNA repair protein RadC [Proteiniborus sp. MB09-C3]|uniref:RadC family protein n=1 Tax=Proteiniborus sp. MB09-C3 TaxID=3050072 RepID=UPI00255729C3|nr:DNA repair protein RadC [Proteiniborus sp. MB09-C3]WIV10596.1 DNA repair protein RadC [Proteiniborus sp. MB09-C3]